MDLSIKEKYLLTKIEPKLFYLKYFKSVQVYFNKTLIRKKITNVMLMGNN
ncbi:MAG TPA: hypothetical protein VD908_17535 [Cytophagales bacterium]|nr:hypothetical protein [Cytophagales bacterium]